MGPPVVANKLDEAETGDASENVDNKEYQPAEGAKEDTPTTNTQEIEACNLEDVHISGLHVFFNDARKVIKLDELGLEILHIAVPATLALAADPLASLVDTAFVGRIGPVELAAVGISIAVFNQVSRVAIYPLVSVTTSFVAEESASCVPEDEEQEIKDVEKDQQKDSGEVNCISPTNNQEGSNKGKVQSRKKYIPTVSSAMVVGGVLGILQTILLVSGGKLALQIMGVKSDSPMMSPAHKYLTLRALGSPAVLLALAMQGVFRGFKDTKTPLYATVIGDVMNIVLDAIFILAFKWGVSGAAIAHVISQYLILLILLWRMLSIVNLFPPSVRDLKFGRFLKCGFLLLARVIAVTICVTLAASMAARHGSIPMAAFQIGSQMWLSTSLIADGLAVAAQAILATAFAKGDHHKAMVAAARVLQLGILLGLVLAALLGVFMQFGAGVVFTKSKDVMAFVHLSTPFVAGSQPLNSLAFVFDGINFGASDYTFSAYSMIIVAIISIISLVILSASHGFIGIWIGLLIYIALRALSGVWRMGAAKGPWSFLRH